MTNYLQCAFNQVCDEATEAQGAFVVLIERAPFYGGPEEGGWNGEDQLVVAYQHFTTREAADAAKEKVEALAADLSQQSRREFGDRCLRETEWLEARGLDDNFLPEPDGPSQFLVVVTDTLPENRYGSRQWD